MSCEKCIHEWACQMQCGGNPMAQENAKHCACYETVQDSTAYFIGKMDARRWIPANDELPENASRCLVSRHDYVTGANFVDILWYDSGEWWDRQNAGDYAVTHWMPLPEPKNMNGCAESTAD